MTTTIAAGAITSAKILDGTIASNDLSSSIYNSLWSLNASGDVSRTTGNVGIGTTAPSAKLDVNGNIILSAPSATLTFNTGDPYVTVPTAKTMTLGTSGLERMRIDSSGSVGTGTTTPGAALQVSAANTGFGQLILYNPGSSVADVTGIEFKHYSPWKKAYIRDEILGGWPTKLHFGVASGPDNASTRMTIDGGTGNVGIGTTSPTFALLVTGDINAAGTVRVNGRDSAWQTLTSATTVTLNTQIFADTTTAAFTITLPAAPAADAAFYALSGGNKRLI